MRFGNRDALVCAVLSLTVIFVAACGSGGGDASGTGGAGGSTPTGNGTAVVGPGGGTVLLGDGPAMVVPAGALGSVTTLTIAPSPIAAPSGAVTGVFQFGPDGTTFSAPVKVTFPVPAATSAASVALYWTKPGSAAAWDVLPLTVSGGVATGHVTHFSAGFVGAACTPGATCAPANPCHVGVTTCNGTPACADGGANVADGTSCGGANFCTAGTCGPATSTTLAITGAVNGPWVEGVTVTLAGAASRTGTTDASGQYAFRGLAAGTYTVTPSLAGYAYAPAAPQVTLSAADARVDFTASPSVASYAISGTVRYSGSQRGRTYVMATCTSVNGCVTTHHPGKSGSPTVATSIATAGGAYVIRGLLPGTYSLSAAVDAQGSGFFNGNDPSGTGTVTVANGDLAGVDVTITDPAIVLPAAPTIPLAVPMDGAVVLQYQGQHTGPQSAVSYKLYWGTDAAASNRTPRSFPVASEEDWSQFVHAGLTNGEALYYQLAAVNPAGEGPRSAVTGPVIVGNPHVGGSTVSGTLTLPVPATGPVFVGLWDWNTISSGSVFGAIIGGSAGLAVPYSFSGVPDGSFAAMAWVDMNGNGVLDLGDQGGFMGNCGSPSIISTITVRGNTRLDGAVDGRPAYTDVQTQHYRASTGAPDTYNVTTSVQGVNKLPVAATLYAGPGARVPLDMPVNQMNLRVQCAWAGFSRTVVRPAVGDAYRYRVTYSDGTAQDLTASVTEVLDSFAQNLGQTTTTPYSRNAPLLTWDAPATPPSDHGYRVSVTGPDNAWYYFGDGSGHLHSMPSTARSVLFNVDGHASKATLTTGVTYTVEVEVVDLAGNSAAYRTTYTP